MIVDVLLVVSKRPPLKTEKYESMNNFVSLFPKRWHHNTIPEVSMSISPSDSRSLLVEG
jgi:hypothetical protein